MDCRVIGVEWSSGAIHKPTVISDRALAAIGPVSLCGRDFRRNAVLILADLEQSFTDRRSQDAIHGCPLFAFLATGATRPLTVPRGSSAFFRFVIVARRALCNSLLP
jgi:hypothetical protein